VVQNRFYGSKQILWFKTDFGHKKGSRNFSRKPWFCCFYRLLDDGSYTAGTNGSTTLSVLRIVNRHETYCFYVIYVAYIAHVAHKINGSKIF